MKTVSTEELSEKVNDGGHRIIDVRPIEAYNGWQTRSEKRGGHIEGASSFPLKFTQMQGWEDMLESKGFGKKDAVTTYGYDAEESEEMAEKLEGAGYSEVRTYDEFFRWCEDECLPMQRLKRYEKLVYPQWVNELINGWKPPGYDGREYVICHCTYGWKEDYDAGHIPGAIHFDTNLVEDPETWNRRSPKELEKNLTDMGISSDTLVVAYGRFSDPNNDDPYTGRNAGHLGAIRCAQLMMYAGVEDVRVLNAGMMSWKNEGLDVSTDEVKPEPVKEFGVKVPAHPEYIVDIDEAKKLIESPEGELVAIRSWSEYIGDVSGYNYIGKKGRIPGSVFGNNGSDAYRMENYRNPDQSMREYHEVEKNWAENGVTSEKHIAFYCGTGWRASEAFLNAYLMGWPNISVYDGGWMQWSSDPENPVETGDPGDQEH